MRNLILSLRLLGLMLAATLLLGVSAGAAVVGGVDMGNLTDYLFVFTDGSRGADFNWQGATKGYCGDVAVNGLYALERTSGKVPYGGTIYTNDSTLGAWQGIVDQNTAPPAPNSQVSTTQAWAVTGQASRISGLQSDLSGAFSQINALGTTYTVTDLSKSFGAGGLDGLDTSGDGNRTYVINITANASGVSNKMTVKGDAGDVYILRWDTDADFSNGYQGTVKFQSGGAIVPLGNLMAGNFINVAGDINSSGGGTSPVANGYPTGPRYDNGTGALIEGGADFDQGGFFTGYWLTTGDPVTHETQPLSNANFVGGWYSSTSKFSMTSGTNGVYVAPVPEPSSIFGALAALASTAACFRRRRSA